MGKNAAVEQLSFVDRPVVTVEFDPDNLAYGAPSGDLTGYEDEWGIFWGCYTAWPKGFPCAVGQGNSEHWALVDLARELRAWDWQTDTALAPAGQLACAVASLDEAELVAYLKRLAQPATLSNHYALVLR